MERIGIVASKAAKGNIVLYNSFVVLLSVLLSLFVFFLSAFSIFIALFLVAVVTDGFFSPEGQPLLWMLLQVSIGSLAVVVGIINLFAILKNFRWRRKRKTTSFSSTSKS